MPESSATSALHPFRSLRTLTRTAVGLPTPSTPPSPRTQRSQSKKPRCRNVRSALKPAARLTSGQVLGGLYSVLVWLACFIAASAS
jgi:hypothetical protein